MAALGGAAKNPADVMTASIRLSSDLARIPSTVLNSWIRKPKGDDKGPSDRRFADPAWTDNPYFHALRLAYLAQCEFARSLVDSSGVDAKQAAKASLGLNLLLDAVAPTNFLVSNPVAMKRAFETAGMSLLRGARNFALDVVQNKGRPRQVDSSAFTVGENLATTPAKVVFRNELMELLQYEPQTDTVHGTPLLCSPPWINKYYIMDLAPERSFIEWADPAQQDSLRNQLPQSHERDVRHHPGGLSHFWAAASVGRHLGSHRFTQDRHRRTLPRWCAHRDHGGLPNADRRRQGRQCDLAQHHARLLRSRPVGGFHRRSGGRSCRKGNGQGGRHARGRVDGRNVRHHACERPDIQLCGVELAARAGSAGVRHSRLERRQHENARRDARVLPPEFLRPKPACPRATRNIGSDDRPVHDQVERLCGQREERSHRAVEVGVQDHPTVLRDNAIRPQQWRAYRWNRQPARPEVVVSVRGRQSRRGRRLDVRRKAQVRNRGGSTGRSGRPNMRAR